MSNSDLYTRYVDPVLNRLYKVSKSTENSPPCSVAEIKKVTSELFDIYRELEKKAEAIETLVSDLSSDES